MTKLTEGLTPHAGWLTPEGEFHKLGGDERYWHLHWIRDNAETKVPRKFHVSISRSTPAMLAGIDPMQTMLSMMAGGWIRKSDKDGYETTASHEHKAESVIRDHILKHHPDVTEYMLDVNHPHGGFSHSKVLSVDRPRGRIVTDIARARAFPYGGESYVDTLIRQVLREGQLR